MHAVSLIPATVPVRKIRVYRVQPHDTAHSISMAFYRNPLYARQILANNGGSITAGQSIVIP